MVYGSSFDLKETFEYDFNVEKNFSYKGLTNKEIVKHLAIFISKLWQIHVFSEGNTRTTAVFFILYLRKLGYDVTNDIFANNAWYFRNAMVRANYTNLDKKIYETTEYLELFIENLLFHKKHKLKNRYLHVNYQQKIDNETPDIEVKTPDIEVETLDIEAILNKYKLNSLTRKNITKVYNIFKDYEYFGRNEICSKINLSPSTVSELIKKMLEFKIITPMVGRGKGKYTISKIIKFTKI